jgi:N-acetylneuraminic acid mutarotase
VLAGVIYTSTGAGVRSYDPATGITGSAPSLSAGHGTTPALTAIGSTAYLVSGVSTANVDALDTATVNALAVSGWSTLTALPAARSGAAVSTDGTRIYASHGTVGSAVRNDGLTVSTSGVATAMTTSALNTIRTGAAGAWCNGKHYAFGGMTDTNNIPGQVDAYTPAGTAGQSGTWASAFGMVNPAAYAAAVAIGTDIYVVGGQSTQAVGSALTAFARYNTLNNTWTNLTATAPLPAARTQGAMVAYNGKLYYLGGKDTANVSTTTVYVFDPAVGTWSTSPIVLPFGPDGYAATVVGSVVYLGLGASPTQPIAVDLATNTVSRLVATAASTTRAGAVAIGNMIYLVSGSATANVDIINTAIAGTTPFTLRTRLVRALVGART